MKEKSQIDDMRAAIRGDLERGRNRQRPSPVVPPEEQAETEPPAEDAPRPGLLSSLFKRG
jgi:hypothetical protein